MSNDNETLFLAKPEEKRIYSIAGYRVIAKVLENQLSISFPTLVKDLILNNCELFDMSPPVTGDSGLKGTIEGLYKLSKRLLLADIPGISAESLKKSTSNHFGVSLGVVPGIGFYSDNSWGLGFEIKGKKTGHWMPKCASLETFGHFGRSGAFFFVDPLNLIAFSGISRYGFQKDSRLVWSKMGEMAYEIKEQI
jgi:CubicO group peptidase (beta-lactamase class C family)